MQRKYFATDSNSSPRLTVFLDMPGDQWAVVWEKKQLRPTGKMQELYAGIARRLPHGPLLQLQLVPIEDANQSTSEGIAENTAEDTPQSTLNTNADATEATPSHRLYAWLDGVQMWELPAHGAHDSIRNAVNLLFLVGALDWLLGLILLAQTHTLPRPLLTGAVFVVLGFFVRQQKMWAARTSIIVAGLDMAITLSAAAKAGSLSSFVLTLIARVLLIFALLQAVNALRELRASRIVREEMKG